MSIIKVLKKNSIIVSSVRISRYILNKSIKFFNLNFSIYLPISSKYFGPPKKELWYWESVKVYVEKKRNEINKPLLWELYEQSVTINPPVLTLGIPEADADLEIKRNYWSSEYVCMFPNARVYMRDFFLITEDDYLMQLLSNYYGHEPYSHILYHRIKLPIVKKLRGKTLMLTGGDGYYHVMLDSICTFKLIDEIGLGFSDFEQIIIFDYNERWYDLAFARLGIPSRKLIRAGLKEAYEFEELYITTRFEKHGIWYSDYLKSIFKPKEIATCISNKIFISRNKTTKRKFVNEYEVVNLLKSKGFSIVFSEDFSIEEQVAIHANASHIVSAHGANLVNILFCKPGTKVCEIRFTKHTSYHKKTYFEMASDCKLDYYLLYCNEGRLPEEGDESESDMYVNINDLEKMLTAMGC
jgi:capsular polysaccharide biosynthesis protein